MTDSFREATGDKSWVRAARLAKRISDKQFELDEPKGWPTIGECFEAAWDCVHANTDTLETRWVMGAIHWVWLFRLSPYPRVRARAYHLDPLKGAK